MCRSVTQKKTTSRFEYTVRFVMQIPGSTRQPISSILHLYQKMRSQGLSPKLTEASIQLMHCHHNSVDKTALVGTLVILVGELLAFEEFSRISWQTTFILCFGYVDCFLILPFCVSCPVLILSY